MCVCIHICIPKCYLFSVHSVACMYVFSAWYWITNGFGAFLISQTIHPTFQFSDYVGERNKTKYVGKAC